jgi:hypothetical protein
MTARPWIVCGFFTPDYRPWAERLIASLEAHGAPHDIVERPKLVGGWEANTMAKARAVLEAMDRHPGKVVVFLDVDCEVRGDLAPLAHLSADVAFYVRARRRRRGGMRFGVRSGTLVLKPTAAARRFVDAWVEASATAEHGDVDQTTLMLAIGSVPGVSFEPLDAKWCATAGDNVAEPVILHDQASRDAPKVTGLQRIVQRLWRGGRAPIGAPCAS